MSGKLKVLYTQPEQALSANNVGQLHVQDYDPSHTSVVKINVSGHNPSRSPIGWQDVPLNADGNARVRRKWCVCCVLWTVSTLALTAALVLLWQILSTDRHIIILRGSRYKYLSQTTAGTTLFISTSTKARSSTDSVTTQEVTLSTNEAFIIRTDVPPTLTPDVEEEIDIYEDNFIIESLALPLVLERKTSADEGIPSLFPPESVRSEMAQKAAWIAASMGGGRKLRSARSARRGAVNSPQNEARHVETPYSSGNAHPKETAEPQQQIPMKNGISISGISQAGKSREKSVANMNFTTIGEDLGAQGQTSDYRNVINHEANSEDYFYDAIGDEEKLRRARAVFSRKALLGYFYSENTENTPLLPSHSTETSSADENIENWSQKENFRTTAIKDISDHNWTKVELGAGSVARRLAKRSVENVPDKINTILSKIVEHKSKNLKNSNPYTILPVKKGKQNEELVKQASELINRLLPQNKTADSAFLVDVNSKKQKEISSIQVGAIEEDRILKNRTATEKDVVVIIRKKTLLQLIRNASVDVVITRKTTTTGRCPHKCPAGVTYPEKVQTSIGHNEKIIVKTTTEEGIDDNHTTTENTLATTGTSKTTGIVITTENINPIITTVSTIKKPADTLATTTTENNANTTLATRTTENNTNTTLATTTTSATETTSGKTSIRLSTETTPEKTSTALSTEATPEKTSTALSTGTTSGKTGTALYTSGTSKKSSDSLPTAITPKKPSIISEAPNTDENISISVKTATASSTTEATSITPGKKHSTSATATTKDQTSIPLDTTTTTGRNNTTLAPTYTSTWVKEPTTEGTEPFPRTLSATSMSTRREKSTTTTTIKPSTKTTTEKRVSNSRPPKMTTLPGKTKNTNRVTVSMGTGRLFTTTRMIPGPTSATTTTTIDTTTTKTTIRPCRKRWAHFRGFCYKAEKYLGDWEYAYKFCRYGHIAELVSIHSQAETDFLLGMFGPQCNNNVCEELTFTTSIHIGLNDIRKEGHYRWTDGSPLDFVRWSEHEPSNSGHPYGTRRRGEDCAELRIAFGFGTWNDIRCRDGPKHPFICKAPAFKHTVAAHNKRFGTSIDFWMYSLDHKERFDIFERSGHKKKRKKQKPGRGKHINDI